MPVDLLLRTASFQDFASRWGKHSCGTLEWGGLWGSAKTLFAAACCKQWEAPLLVVTSDSESAHLATEDLKAFGMQALELPGAGPTGQEKNILRDRFRAVSIASRETFNGALVAPLHALLQTAPGRSEEGKMLELRAGDKLEPEALMRALVRAGFERVPAVSAASEFACRGDIVDFLAPAWGDPIRLEFFDDELESLRFFDLETQRTQSVLKEINVPLDQELKTFAGQKDLLPLDALNSEFRVVILAPNNVKKTRLGLVGKFGESAKLALQRWEKGLAERIVLSLATLPGRDGTTETLSVEEYRQGFETGLALLAGHRATDESVFLFHSTEAEEKHSIEFLKRTGDCSHVSMKRGGIATGFRIPEARGVFLHRREFNPGHKVAPPRSQHTGLEGAKIEGPAALRTGDLVIHAIHGLAKFQGIGANPEKEDSQDILLLEFANNATLKSPASRVDLIERYIGAGGSTHKLDRLGSGAFARRKKKVAEAVEDIAAEMLDVQAQREMGSGKAMPTSDPSQHEFEESFQWDDTPDQASAMQEIHRDLSAPRAMDRLLCGDVGYGKTELAARAIFRAVLSGYQAAVLVPTTILAEQHARSLAERFSNWGLELQHLSRLVPPKKRKEVIKALEQGKVDVVIGTHRILSRDVNFKNLGLVVIDEEQRFGVSHKETLKKKRAHVDVLTLTATPIPRTLHMALAGIRDISSLETAPSGRLEIHTEIRHREDDPLLRKALERELNRGGQVFFVHNRVRTLKKTMARIQKLAPHAKIVCGHGQMDPGELEPAMLAFVRGEADILCSTTIIESGLDISNANTIFIDDAHRYGVADLHQLRGRVGRGDRPAWCYLLTPRGKPLSNDAKRRLKAVEELRYLGAGYQIAMRDLEIRGAGNLLGAEQSGHINAVGYETYRRLLKKAVAKLRKETQQSEDGSSPVCDLALGVSAALPASYIADEETRLALLRNFDSTRSSQELATTLAGICEQFGPPPKEAESLGAIFFLKHFLGRNGFSAIQPGDKERLLCSLRDHAKVLEFSKNGKFEFRKTGIRRGVWVLPKGLRKGAETLKYLLDVAASCQSSRTPRKSNTTAGKQ